MHRCLVIILLSLPKALLFHFGHHIILTIFIYSNFIKYSLQRCYRVNLANFGYGYNPHLGMINVTFHNVSMMHADFEFFTTIRNEAWKIDISKWSPFQGITTLLNETLNAREFVRRSRNPYISAAINVMARISSLTPTRPIAPKQYYIRANLFEVAGVVPLRLFYKPNVVMLIKIGLYDQVPIANFTEIGFLRLGVVIEKLCKNKT